MRKSIIEVRVPVPMLIVRSTAFLDSVASILAFTKYFTLTPISVYCSHELLEVSIA
ncbi:MAG TPA: hypothetical protein VFT71_05915 [Candidatus Nitrosocosmicus sp.]|nr:hypothetical protein [Candidatus Nitrosocosmicus sp.]